MPQKKSTSKRPKYPIIVSPFFARKHKHQRNATLKENLEGNDTPLVTKFLSCHSEDSESDINKDLTEFPFHKIDERRLLSYAIGLALSTLSEEVAHDPFQLIVATMLLNKTTGKVAIPVFRVLMEQWPTPERMSQAPLLLLQELLQPLGLSNIRAQRLIDLSHKYISQPPDPTILHKSRARDYLPTPISHLPGVGKYALDSYRIFCTTGEVWKEVLPTDIPLCKYLKWKWAIQEYRVWTPERGPLGKADEMYYQYLIPYYRYPQT